MVDTALVLELGDFATVIKADTSLAKYTEMSIVALLIKGHENITLITCIQYLTGTEMQLENRGATADGRWDGHLGHHILLSPARETGQDAANGLDAFLTVAGQTNDRVTKCLGGRRRGSCGCEHILVGGWLAREVGNVLAFSNAATKQLLHVNLALMPI